MESTYECTFSSIRLMSSNSDSPPSISAHVGAKRCEVPTRLAVYPTPYGSVIVIPEATLENKTCEDLEFRNETTADGSFFLICFDCIHIWSKRCLDSIEFVLFFLWKPTDLYTGQRRGTGPNLRWEWFRQRILYKIGKRTVCQRSAIKDPRKHLLVE